MWTKLYLAVLAVSSVLAAFFMFYAWSWLQSIGLPINAAAGAEYHAAFASATIWLATILLLIIANALLWTNGKAWPMWATFLYFAVFIVAQYFWLERSIVFFKEEHLLSEHHVYIAPIAAALLVIAAGAVTFFDKYVVIRLRAKTYPAPVINEEPETEDPA